MVGAAGCSIYSYGISSSSSSLYNAGSPFMRVVFNDSAKIQHKTGFCVISTYFCLWPCCFCFSFLHCRTLSFLRILCNHHFMVYLTGQESKGGIWVCFQKCAAVCHADCSYGSGHDGENGNVPEFRAALCVVLRQSSRMLSSSSPFKAPCRHMGWWCSAFVVCVCFALSCCRLRMQNRVGEISQKQRSLFCLGDNAIICHFVRLDVWETWTIRSFFYVVEKNIPFRIVQVPFLLFVSCCFHALQCEHVLKIIIRKRIRLF